jgi:hypothetical protein
MRLFRALFLCAAFVAPTLVANLAQADGCYLCGSGSDKQCKDYCRYTGPDTFDARRKCEKRGCKVSGTGSCPTAVNYTVCQAPAKTSVPGDAQLAAIAWCTRDSKDAS